MSVNINVNSPQYQLLVSNSVTPTTSQGVTGTHVKNYSLMERVVIAVAAALATLGTLFVGLFVEEIRNLWKIVLYANLKQKCTVWLPTVPSAIQPSNITASSTSSQVGLIAANTSNNNTSAPQESVNINASQQSSSNTPLPSIVPPSSNVVATAPQISTTAPTLPTSAPVLPSRWQNFTLNQLKDLILGGRFLQRDLAYNCLTRRGACDQLDTLTPHQFDLLKEALEETQKAFESGTTNPYVYIGDLPKEVILQLTIQTTDVTANRILLGPQVEELPISPVTWTALVFPLCSSIPGVFPRLPEINYKTRLFDLSY